MNFYEEVSWKFPVIIGLLCLNQSSMFKLNCKVWFVYLSECELQR